MWSFKTALFYHKCDMKYWWLINWYVQSSIFVCVYWVILKSIIINQSINQTYKILIKKRRKNKKQKRLMIHKIRRQINGDLIKSPRVLNLNFFVFESLFSWAVSVQCHQRPGWTSEPEQLDSLDDHLCFPCCCCCRRWCKPGTWRMW